MLTDKANVLCLLQVLKDYSDGEHILPMGELIGKMRVLYGIGMDRRTVYSAVELLCTLGYDISLYKENGRGYYLRTRELELPEARLLIDSILRSAFIPPKQTSDLIEKIQSLLSIHQRKKYRHLNTAGTVTKTENKEVFYTIELLDEAVEQKRQITFIYLAYDFDMKLKPRRERKYLVNPYAMVCANERYYLVCNYDAHTKISHYRIDRMKDITIEQEPIKASPRDFNAQTYTNDAIYMFGGGAETVCLQCHNSILDHVLDKFGTDIRIARNENQSFRAYFKTAPAGVKFWALQYLPYCEILEPTWLRSEVIESLKSQPYHEIGLDSE